MRRARRWRMPSARTKVLVIAAGVATVAVYASAFALSTTQDRPDHLDTPVVRDAASTACARLRTEVDALPPLPDGASARDRQARVGEQDRLVRRLVQQVRAVGPQALEADVPAQQWLGDWTRLTDARTAYVAGADGPFSVPVEDGEPISTRMGRVGVPACVVPNSLLVAP